MKIGKGNRKLGDNVATLSRPVGPTCPQSCPFLGHGCYAERMTRYTSVKNAWREGLDIDPVKLAADLVKLPARFKALRIHVGGDFLEPSGNVDRRYLAGLLRALRRTRDAGRPFPAWVYTHAWQDMAPHRKALERAGVQVFASVHNERDATLAAVLGYRLAWDSGTKLESKAPVKDGRGLTCPEQRKGVSCEDCKYCFTKQSGRRNVVFYRH